MEKINIDFGLEMSETIKDLSKEELGLLEGAPIKGKVDGFTLLTWNINGIRSLGDFTQVLTSLEADIICLQETKVTRDLLTEEVSLVPGFSSYFSFSRRRSGYSGTATYCRGSATPVQSEEGLLGVLGEPAVHCVGGTSQIQQEFTPEEAREIDSEGRAVLTRHRTESGGHLTVINVYCPRADPDREDRKRHKLLFYRALDLRANALRAEGDHVVILGDINTSHREIDHCEPYQGFRDRPDRRFLDHLIKTQGEEEAASTTGEETGCSRKDLEDEEPEEWVASLRPVQGGHFLDSFRHLHPDAMEAFTCWNTEKNCRATNYGTRIDYILTSSSLAPFLVSCDIQPWVMGSDHCPVIAEYSLPLLPNLKPPRGATLHFQEFAGKQVKLSQYFTKVEPPKRKVETEPEGSVAKKARTLESRSTSIPINKVKPEKKKITNFFAPKTKKEPKPEYKTDVTDTAEDLKVSESQITAPPGRAASNASAVSAWGAVFKPVAAPPNCPGHQEKCVRRKVTKKGPNTGREFWCCGRGEGKQGDPMARCNFFKWVK